MSKLSNERVSDERPEGHYWTRYGTNPNWDVMYWRDGYFWGSADDGYLPQNIEVGPRIFAPNAPELQQRRASVVTPEAVAQIIDPDAWSQTLPNRYKVRQQVALEKAHRIAALSVSHETDGETEAAFDMLAHLARQREWSGRTFGPGTRMAGVIDHIRKELREIEADPSDITEWIDVVILALDGAWRAGYQPQQIIDAMVAKQTKNEARTWPDWRIMPADKAIEHDRSGEASAPTDDTQGVKREAVAVSDEIVEAEEIVAELFSDLRDRRFLKWLFKDEEGLIGDFPSLRSLDLAVQDEIRQAWVGIISSALTTVFGASHAEIDRLTNRLGVAEYKLGQAVNVVQPMLIRRAEAAERERDEARENEDDGLAWDSLKGCKSKLRAAEARLAAMKEALSEGLDALYVEMQRRMEQPKYLDQEGGSNPDWLPVDDTQVGIEFAYEFITAALFVSHETGEGETEADELALVHAEQEGESDWDDICERLLDAQQDINLAANERMDQSLCDASSLIGEIEPKLRKLRPAPTVKREASQLEAVERSVAYLADQLETVLDQLSASDARADAAELERDAMREALEFYAEVGKYPAPLTGGMGDLWSDCGQIARTALAAGENG